MYIMCPDIILVDGDRAPLYQTPVRRESIADVENKPNPVMLRQKRKSICGAMSTAPEVKTHSPKRASSAKV